MSVHRRRSVAHNLRRWPRRSRRPVPNQCGYGRRRLQSRAYVALRGIPGIAEDDDVAALDRLPPVHELVDEDALLVVERGHHAGALHLHGLVQEDDDECRNRQRNDEIPQPHGEYRCASSAGWTRRAAWFAVRWEPSALCHTYFDSNTELAAAREIAYGATGVSPVEADLATTMVKTGG